MHNFSGGTSDIKCNFKGHCWMGLIKSYWMGWSKSVMRLHALHLQFMLFCSTQSLALISLCFCSHTSFYIGLVKY